MNSKIARILNGVLELSDEEKRELIEQLRELEEYPNLTEQEIRKSIVGNESYSVSLGPTPTACPCCGR